MFPKVNLKLIAKDIPALLPHSPSCPLCILYLDIVDIPYDSVHTNFRVNWTTVKGSTRVHFILFRISRVLLLETALLHGLKPKKGGYIDFEHMRTCL